MSDGAEAAIAALNDSEIEGRKLVVNESRPRETR
jgi:RNA recognition motif-containing protein